MPNPAVPPAVPQTGEKTPPKKKQGCLQSFFLLVALCILIPICGAIVIAFTGRPSGGSGNKPPQKPAQNVDGYAIGQARSVQNEQNRQTQISNIVAELKENQNPAERAEKLSTLIRLDPGTKEFPEEVSSILQQMRDRQKEADRAAEQIRAEAEKAAAEADRKNRFSKSFSGWDGSHRKLEEFIKESMNDPKSYEHVDTVFVDRGDHLIVTTTFRGKNGFGGVVKTAITAKVDLDGNVLSVIEKRP